MSQKRRSFYAFSYERIYLLSGAPYSPDFSWDDPAPLFRRHFVVEDGLQGAVLSICALGLGEAYLNGRPVTQDRYISPVGNYDKTLWYTEYTITELLHPGDNLAAVALGNGFYNEGLHTAWDFDAAPWRDVPKLLFSLELRYADHTEHIGSDTAWLCMRARSPYRFHQLRYGEYYDARCQVDWMQPSATEAGWVPAALASRPPAACGCVRVRRFVRSAPMPACGCFTMTMAAGSLILGRTCPVMSN